MAMTMQGRELWLAKLQFNSLVRLRLYEKIASFMRQGTPLHDVLILLGRQYEKHAPGDVRAKVMHEWSVSMGSGQAFADTLSEWAPMSEVMLIKAGEKGGSLAEAFSNAVQATTAQRTMISTMKTKLSYPVLLLTVLFLLVFMFSTQVIPKLTEMMPPEQWPAMAHKLYGLAHFVEHQWMFVLLTIAGIVVALNWSMPRVTGDSRRWMDKVAPWSVYRSFQSSMFLIAISAMMRTGRPLSDSVEDMAAMANPYVAEHLSRMQMHFKLGTPNGAAMNGGFFDTETGIELEIYGDTAEFSAAMDQIGRTAVDNSIESISKASALVNNIVLFLVAVYMGWVLMSINQLSMAIASAAGK